MYFAIPFVSEWRISPDADWLRDIYGGNIIDIAQRRLRHDSGWQFDCERSL